MKRTSGEVVPQDYPPGEKPLELHELIPVVFDDEQKVGEVFTALEEKISKLAEEFEEFLGRSGFELLNPEIMVTEPSMNGLYHGVLGLGHVEEKYEVAKAKIVKSLQKGIKIRGWVQVGFKVFKDKAIIEVADSGEGFDPKKLENPTKEENLLKTSGRGLFIIFDKAGRENVEFNEKANTIKITLFKNPKVEGSGS